MFILSQQGLSALCYPRTSNTMVDSTENSNVLQDVIDTIYSLLLVPEFSDPINTVVALNFHWDEVR